MGELCEELARLVVGGVVREAAPLPPRDLLVVLESDTWDGVRRVRLSASPDGPRLHLETGRVHRHDGATGPFFERLAKQLAGAQLRRVAPVKQDRIASLEFTGDAGRCEVVAELVGRHANLLLLDRSGAVLDWLVAPKKPKEGRAPRLALGEPYEPPPGRPPADPGPSIVEAFPAPDGDAETGLRALAPLSWRVGSALGGAVEDTERARSAKHLKERLARRLAGAERSLRGLDQRERAVDDAERVLQDGELLKAAIGQLKRGMESIELVDWFDENGGSRRIALDPKRTPAQNVEKVFDRYHKLVRSAGTLAEERERTTARRTRLAELLERLEAGEDPAELERVAVAEKLVDALATQRGKRVQKAAPRRPYLRFVSAAGTEILVGRNARDNDELTLRVARGNDLWLHTADTPGSHVILRVEKNREPLDEDVLDAAHLAVQYSPLKGARRADVHVAHRKLVHKRKGSPPGLVHLSGGRTRSVRLEPARLERLLGEGRREAT